MISSSIKCFLRLTVVIILCMTLLPAKAFAVCEQQPACNDLFSDVISKTAKVNTALVEMANAVQLEFQKVLGVDALISKGKQNDAQAMADTQAANDQSAAMAKRTADAIDAHRPSLQQCIELSQLGNSMNSEQLAKAIEEIQRRKFGRLGRFRQEMPSEIATITEVTEMVQQYGNPELYPDLAKPADPDLIDQHIEFPTKLTIPEKEQLAAEKFGRLINGETSHLQARSPVGEMVHTDPGMLALDNYYIERARRSLVSIPYREYISARASPPNNANNSEAVNPLLVKMNMPKINRPVSHAEIMDLTVNIPLPGLMPLPSVGDEELQRLGYIRKGYGMKNLWAQRNNASLGNMMQGVMIAMDIENVRARVESKEGYSAPIGGAGK